jgi:predicted AAA+ superfamily ATPase
MIKRTVLPCIQKSWKRGKSILLLGPRQTGKTTLAQSFSFDLTINFLSNSVRQAHERNPDLILKEVMGLKKRGIAFVLVDEVQKVPNIMDPIQYLIDKKKAQFFITGSSARKLKQQADINLLPGRVIAYRLETLSLQEQSSEDNDVESYLYYGQLPEIILEKEDENKEELLQSYVEIYLEEEIRKEANLKNITGFYHFLQFAAERSGHIISYSGIAQDIGISHVTVKSYYEILESTLIADRIDPIISSKTRKKLIRSPRYLFFDMGVRRLAAKEGINQPDSSKGLLFEQWVGLEILKYIRSNKINATLHFWQDPEVAEVDWVIKKESTYIPIEVKLKTNIASKELRHLNYFLNEYNCPKGGFVIFNGQRPQQASEKITFQPWTQLLELLESLL